MRRILDIAIILIPDCDTTCSSKPFEFPPGHKIRIRNFILELRKPGYEASKKATTSTRKRIFKRPVGQTSYKKAKHDGSSSENEGESTISSISGQIRRSISKWVKKQPNEKLKNLQENKHFVISVSHVAKESSSFSPSIKCCACSTIYFRKRSQPRMHHF